MIYPRKRLISDTQEEKPSLWVSAKGLWKDLIGSQQENIKSNDTMEPTLFADFEVPEMEDMRSLCLREYLQDYLTVFRSGILDPSVQPMHVIDGVKCIFKCLQIPQIQDGTPKRYMNPMTVTWRYKDLEEVSQLLVCITHNYMTTVT